MGVVMGLAGHGSMDRSGVSFPRERIFGLGSGPKTDVLARLVKAQRDKAR